MIRFSKKVEYGLMAMLHMARKIDGELTTARELAEKYNISLELTGKILQKLAKNNLIVSTQGVKGGYQILLSSEKINVNEIIRAIDGPIRITKCMNCEEDENCDRQHFCIIRPSMKYIQTKIYDFFDKITLKHFEDNLKLEKS